MLKELTEYRIKARGIIHVGAHEGQEYEGYIKDGIKNILLFEPVQANFDLLMDTVKDSYPGVRCFNMALGNKTGSVYMFIEKQNRGMSCSVLEPETHLDQYPWIVFDGKEKVKIDKLDNIEFDKSKFNILNVDVQGYELEVFKGAGKTLKSIDAIFTEVNMVEMYKGCALITDIDILLSHFGFVRVTELPNDNWGEALYIKNIFLFDK
jgi:FkbM family methyltransferase